MSAYWLDTGMRNSVFSKLWSIIHIQFNLFHYANLNKKMDFFPYKFQHIFQRLKKPVTVTMLYFIVI